MLLGETALHDVTAHHGNTSRAWACGDLGTILYTADGLHWTTQAPGTTAALYGIAFLETTGGPIIAVGENGTILRTTDSGPTWTPQPSGTTVTLRHVSDFGGVAVGDSGVILRTADWGITWAADASGTTADLFSVSASSAPYAVGTGGTILVYMGSGTWAPRLRGWRQRPDPAQQYSGKLLERAGERHDCDGTRCGGVDRRDVADLLCRRSRLDLEDAGCRGYLVPPEQSHGRRFACGVLLPE